jgi:hypothetical protein
MTTHAKKELTPADVAQALEGFSPAEWDEVRALLWEKKTLKEPSVFWSLPGLEPLPGEPPPTPEGDRMAREALKRMRGVSNAPEHWEEVQAMKWDDTKQARLDALRAAELAGSLDEVGRAELAELIEAVEVEERERLAPAFDRMRAEQAALRQQVQEVETANEQLVVLAAQQERLLADARQLLHDLQQRHQAVREAYQRVTGETLSVGK